MTYEEQADHLSNLIKDQLGVRGANLESRLNRAGRALPRQTRRDAKVLIEAVRLQANPKLARLVDDTAVQRAFDNSQTYLNSIDAGKRRKDRLIGTLATISFNLMAVGAIFIAVLAWRDLI